MELFLLVFAGIGAIVGGAEVHKRAKYRDLWKSFTPNKFNKARAIVYPALSCSEVRKRLLRIASSGGFSDAKLGLWFSWKALFNRNDADLIEVTILFSSQQGLSSRLAGEVFLRWRIGNGVDPWDTIVSTEWINRSYGLVRGEKLLNHILEESDTSLRAASEIALTFNPPAPVAISSTSNEQEIASAFVKNGDFWSFSLSHHGLVKIPRRQYANVDSGFAAQELIDFISKGGVLSDPISGLRFLRWHGKCKKLPNTKQLIETNIAFSQYDQEAHLSQELAIRWEFEDDTKSGTMLMECEWTGKLQASTGDLIRHLIQGFESKIMKSGASPFLGQSVLAARNSTSSAGTAWLRAKGSPGVSGNQPIPKPFWPSLQDYNEAVQNPDSCFIDQELKTGNIELNPLGLPKVATGAFASVYRIQCADQCYALRCFNSQIKDQEERYKRTSRFICSDELNYTVPLHYLEKGILVRGQWYPVLKMEWVEGISIYQYIDENIREQDKLLRLKERFGVMMSELQKAGIAHSDLQHGNIIIKDNDFILVDYDGMFVPELSGFFSHERGHPNYQHPARDGRHFGPYLDNFSAWVIDTALLCLIHEPGFWSRFAGDAESLLFKRRDFESPDQSAILSELCSHRHDELRERGLFLRSLLRVGPERIPFLGPGQPQLLTEQSNNMDSATQQAPEEPADKAAGKGLPDWMR